QTCVTSSLDLLHDIIRRTSTDDDQQSTADSSTETVWHDIDTAQSQTIEPNAPYDPYLFRDEDELDAGHRQNLGFSKTTENQNAHHICTQTAFDQLIQWLWTTLVDGNIVKVSYAYEKLRELGDTVTHYRTFVERMKTFDGYRIICSSKRSGSYIVLNDFSVYLHLMLQNLLDDSGVINIVTFPAMMLASQRQQMPNNIENENLITTSRIIRREIELTNSNTEIGSKITVLSSMNFDDYVKYIPVVLMNIIKLCTMNKNDFNQFLTQNITTNLALDAIECDQNKQLKQLSICFDMITCKERTNFNPKQLLLGYPFMMKYFLPTVEGEGGYFATDNFYRASL
ncbi:unnamed protein product, partial [Didymodactylos carnosus]